MFRTAFAMLFLGTSLNAEAAVCNFALECFEGEECTETDYSVSLEIPIGDGPMINLVTPSETLPLLEAVGLDEVPGTGSAHYIFLGESALHLFSTETPDDQHLARYTVHMEGPIAVTYHGTCEETS